LAYRCPNYGCDFVVLQMDFWVRDSIQYFTTYKI
jgi:hypothetical protein